MESESLRLLVTEIELLSSLAHDEDQSKHGIFTVLWLSFEGRDLALQAHPE